MFCLIKKSTFRNVILLNWSNNGLQLICTKLKKFSNHFHKKLKTQINKSYFSNLWKKYLQNFIVTIKNKFIESTKFLILKEKIVLIGTTFIRSLLYATKVQQKFFHCWCLWYSMKIFLKNWTEINWTLWLI